MADRLDARLYVRDALAAGAEVALARGQAHYLAHVLRLASGVAVALFNGRDGEWVARIESVAKGGATLRVETQLREQRPDPDLWLVFAPVKRTALDFLVQKATELGVSALVPAITRRTIVERIRRERMEATAIEAAEQCERLSVPDIRDAAPLSRILGDWPDGRRILLCAETGAAEPIHDVLERNGPTERCAILTGPEGGFEQTELDALRKLPFVTAVGLGPRILRADTAALAALSCWQSARGDWQMRPPRRN
jgi:16S rRNA (uracil1498-N3)-methyltransferase